MTPIKDIFYAKMLEANAMGLVMFIFEYQESYYLSYFKKGRWTDPIKIEKL